MPTHNVLSVRAVACAALVAAGLGGVPSAGSACTIASPIPGAPVGGDLVVAGTVTQVERASRDRFGPLAVSIAVDRVLRGSASDIVELRTAPDSAQCGRTFAVGRRYLVAMHEGRGSGPYGRGNLVTSLADAGRELAEREPVGPPDLRWPAPAGFIARASNLAPHQFVDMRGFDAYWTGATAGTRWLVALRRRPARVTAVYGPRGDRVTISTRRLCVTRRRSPPYERLRALRGGVAAIRRSRLELFTGDRRIVITGATPATRLQLASQLFKNSETAEVRTAVERRLAPPTRRAFRRLAACGSPGTLRS